MDNTKLPTEYTTKDYYVGVIIVILITNIMFF